MKLDREICASTNTSHEHEIERVFFSWLLVLTGIQDRTLVGPVMIRLQCFHRGTVDIDPFAFVGIFDAPIDHVPQGRKLLNLFLELRELMGVRVRCERVTHRARHAGFG